MEVDHFLGKGIGHRPDWILVGVELDSFDLFDKFSNFLADERSQDSLPILDDEEFGNGQKPMVSPKEKRVDASG